MHLRVALLLAVAFLLPATLSGCVSCESGPPISARDITGGKATGGNGGFTLQIELSDGPGGPPLPGAGVVVYWSDVRVTEWEHTHVTVDDETVVVAPGDSPRTVEQRHTLRLFSDADGMVTAKVPANRVIGIVAAKTGHTEEWVAALAAGDKGGSAQVAVPLYSETVEFTIEDTWGPGSASGGFVTGREQDVAWQPHPLALGDTPAAQEGYAARVGAITATISWSNDATSFGNLGVGLGPDPADPPTYFEDRDDNLGAGAQEERVEVDVEALRDAGILGARAIHAGAASDIGHFGPLGLPYTLHIVATFDTAIGKFQGCIGDQDDGDGGAGLAIPGPAAWLLLAGLIVVAVAMRRR